MNARNLVSVGRRTLSEAAVALQLVSDRLGDSFSSAVQQILDCDGRVVVTGMGKSGLIGRKIVATLASTGTPALFLHPAEALHGDLGMIAAGHDVALALSYSGETDELLAILPALRRRARALIAVTGSVHSSLGRSADVAIDVSVPREACPHNLAPTTSTTAMVALGDALAMALMEAREFSREDYALLHPAGSLGRRLLLRVADIMRTGEALAVVAEQTPVLEALFAITKAGAGAACITDDTGKLAGILTEGDFRRFLLSVGDRALRHPVADAMTRSPRIIAPERLAVEALDQFENETIRFSDLPVVAPDGKPVGMLMLKDLVRAGIVLPNGGAV